MSRWVWGLGIGCVVVIGAVVAYLMISGGEKGRAAPGEVRIVERTPEEEELARIRIAAADGNLREATYTGRGWIVRADRKTDGVQPAVIFDRAFRFFEDLNRVAVEVEETSVLVVTDSLKDVWGNKLENLPIARFVLSRETFERINWEGFDPRNLLRVADEVWLHDAVLEEIAKEEKGRSQGQGGGESGQGPGQAGGEGSTGSNAESGGA